MKRLAVLVWKTEATYFLKTSATLFKATRRNNPKTGETLTKTNRQNLKLFRSYCVSLCQFICAYLYTKYRKIFVYYGVLRLVKISKEYRFISRRAKQSKKSRLLDPEAGETISLPNVWKCPRNTPEALKLQQRLCDKRKSIFSTRKLLWIEAACTYDSIRNCDCPVSEACEVWRLGLRDLSSVLGLLA